MTMTALPRTWPEQLRAGRADGVAIRFVGEAWMQGRLTYMLYRRPGGTS